MSNGQNGWLMAVFVFSLLTLALASALYAMAVCTAIPIDVETFSAVETVRAILEQTPTPEGGV